ncbi:hypothetical protein [Gracilibacillus alcaliphilus]|uniref:hypothetical protein n=1 Tax=Gracilibacillus alcaliphilus TaxID=1401441 RepID=UPI00195D7B38|nr:hypothetical protein [Gracilibacillus alcaliphilus]MBM7679257.1 hypothetical protein [Gracilibacillus alcaliphilus]
MKVKNVTEDLRFIVWQMKKTSQWPDSEFEIYDSMTTRFVHEFSKDGQIISISRGDKPITRKEKKFALKKLMERSKNDVYAFTSSNDVLYLRQDF